MVLISVDVGYSSVLLWVIICTEGLLQCRADVCGVLMVVYSVADIFGEMFVYIVIY